MKFSYKEELCL